MASKNLLTSEYEPSSKVTTHKGSNVEFLPTSIKINKNNFLANLDNVDIPGSLYEPMVTFLKAHPIGYALRMDPGRLYHSYLCEFWYTASVQPNDSIVFYLKNGSIKRTLDLDTFRRVLHLDYLEAGIAYDTLPKSSNPREMLLVVGYNKKLTHDDGSLITTGTIQVTHLSPTWKLFFTHIVECLGGASGGLDQVNAMQMEIAYALWRDLKIDFADKIYKNLLSKLKGKRTPFVLYIRFLSEVFKHFLQDKYDDASLEFSHPDVTKDFSSTSPIKTEVQISDEMLRYVPLEKRYKTVSAPPAGSESTSGGPQKNEGPTERASGYMKVLKPKSSDQPPLPLRESSTTSSEGLPKDPSDYPKGKRSLKRLRKMSELPTDVSADTSPSGSSKKGPDMSKGNLQTSPSGSSLGRGGEGKEHGSSQAIIESVSAQAPESQISDTTLAPTGDVAEHSHSVAEVARSDPHDVSVLGQTEAEGPHLTAQGSSSYDVSKEAEQPSGLAGGNTSQIQVSMDKGVDLFAALNEVDTIELSSSNSSQEAGDVELVEEEKSEYPEPTSSHITTPIPIISVSQITTSLPEMPPPPKFTTTTTTSSQFSFPQFSPLTPEEISDFGLGEFDAIPSSSAQIPKIHHAIRSIPTSSTPDSPPETLADRVEAHSAKIGDLNLKVIDLKNSLEDLKDTVSRSQRGVLHEMKLYTNNEHAVFKKLNELVDTTNHLNQALKSTHTSVQAQISESLSSGLDSIAATMKKDMATSTEEILKKVQPAFTKEEMVQEVTTEVCKEVQEKMIPRMVTEIKNLLPSTIESSFKGVNSELNRLNAAVTDLKSEVQSNTVKVSGVTSLIENIPHPTPEPSFSAADRVLLEEISQGNSQHSYALGRLKNALVVFGRSLTKSVETSDWTLFKAAVDNMENVNLEDLSKGEELPKQITPMIASMAEVMEATRPSEPQTEGTSGTIVTTQSEGEASLEGEQAKKKGKGKLGEKETEKETEKEDDEHIDVPEDLHKQLRIAQRDLTRKQQELELQEKMRNDTLVQLGVKDTLDATTLGITIDAFRKLKDHPYIVKALEIQEDVRKRLIVLEEEEKLHATSVGVSVEVLRAEKEKEKQKDLAEIQKLVDGAMRSLRKQPVKEVRFRTPKEAAEARTETFKSPTRLSGSQSEAGSVIPPVDVRKMNAEALAKYNQTKKVYESMMTKRSGGAKIVDCFIKVFPNMNTFYVDIKRADGSRKTIDKAVVTDFGFSEWTEMIEALQKKGPSKFESAWIKAIYKKMEIKDQMEKELGIKKPITAQGSSSGSKRKATEASPVSSKRSR